jgi:DNA polymerase-1
VIVNIIDVSGVIYRSFYGFPNLIYNDQELGATYGYCKEMLRLSKQFKDSMFIAAFDSSRKTFRNEIYKDYKANRKEMPKELVSQIDIVKEATKAFGFVKAEYPGYEADDIIASYVKVISPLKYTINIISSDKDLMQLLDVENNVNIYDPSKNRYITREDVIEKFGVAPEKMLDLMALVGDSSDNIPGVQGIGPKTASSLINEFGSLENLIANINNLPKSKKFEVLKNNVDKAILSKKLASLCHDIDVQFEYSKRESRNLNEFFQKLNFKSLIDKI